MINRTSLYIIILEQNLSIRKENNPTVKYIDLIVLSFQGIFLSVSSFILRDPFPHANAGKLWILTLTYHMIFIVLNFILGL